MITCRIPLAAACGDALLAPKTPIWYQLRTLAYHLSCTASLADCGVSPAAVAGYCFGEYAAAVVAGRMSKAEAVEFIVVRAWSIGHIDTCHSDGSSCSGKDCTRTAISDTAETKEVQATMINVFASVEAVRKKLVTMSKSEGDIAIAIHAGPTHVVVSGCPRAIVTCHAYLNAEGMKCKILAAPIDRKSTRLNSSHSGESRMPSSA